ncbi:hypothetical protein PIB30_064053 [Stylosanthes scabra]|uniref:Secreted protein n=1 Tax=Stylosanthes scabra TaxID=79078 RepID=A0ABU6ZKA1_9FABA|nr:hypothetical protein [Stylosanthes scabra]
MPPLTFSVPVAVLLSSPTLTTSRRHHHSPAPTVIAYLATSQSVTTIARCLQFSRLQVAEKKKTPRLQNPSPLAAVLQSSATVSSIKYARDTADAVSCHRRRLSMPPSQIHLH